MTDWRKQRATRRKIDRLEAQLAELYAERKEMIIEMAADMTRREIAGHWGISNPRVTNIINEGGASCLPWETPTCRCRPRSARHASWPGCPSRSAPRCGARRGVHRTDDEQA